jgi:fluoride exporter
MHQDTPPTALHFQPRAALLVGLGGALGTAAREALSLAFPAVDGIPYAIFAINVVGALLLGILLEALLRRGPDAGRRRRLRLLLGTGVLGGFTTYSALAADTARLYGEGATLPATLYALGTVVVGALATGIGVAIGARIAHAAGPAEDAA